MDFFDLAAVGLVSQTSGHPQQGSAAAMAEAIGPHPVGNELGDGSTVLGKGVEVGDLFLDFGPRNLAVAVVKPLVTELEDIEAIQDRAT